MPEAVVSIVRGKDRERIVEESIRLVGGLDNIIKEGDEVLVKPNLTAGYPPESGGTTKPTIVKKTIEEIRRFNPSKIIIGENAGLACDTFEAYERCGWTDLFKEMDIEFVDLEKSEMTEVQVPDPLYLNILRLPKIVFDCDVLVNVPVLKMHHATGISVALKNMFGCLPNLKKREAHQEDRLEEVITDINAVRPPDFTIVDGTIALEGLGGGLDLKHAVNMDLVIAGFDPVAVDAICAEIMMFRPRIRHVVWSAERGLGTNKVEDIEVRGLPLGAATRKFKTPMEQTQDEFPMVRIFGEGRCSGCHCAIATAFSSPRDKPGYGLSKMKEKIRNEITIYLEPADLSGSRETRLIIGDCQEKCKNKGIYVSGCPPKTRRIRKIVEEIAG